jgi:hypothetical protein
MKNLELLALVEMEEFAAAKRHAERPKGSLGWGQNPLTRSQLSRNIFAI